MCRHLRNTVARMTVKKIKAWESRPVYCWPDEGSDAISEWADPAGFSRLVVCLCCYSPAGWRMAVIITHRVCGSQTRPVMLRVGPSVCRKAL